MENQISVSKNPNNESPKYANTEEIIKLLNQQNKLLESINTKLFSSMITVGKETRIDAEVKDINMSMGNMVGFMFKWLIASIPFGIVVGILYAIIIALSY